MHFIKSFKSRLFLLLHVFSTFFAAIVAHTWVEDVSVLQPDGSLGLRGFPRGNVFRTVVGFNDLEMTYLLPPSGPGNGPFVNSTMLMCKDTQSIGNQTDGAPALQASAGNDILLRYQENGHITMPYMPPGKPSPTFVSVYGTLHPSPDDTLLSIHGQWNSDGTGGDQRGVLLTRVPFDDGQCFQVNESPISMYRQSKFGHTPDPIQGRDNWCGTKLSLPTNLESGSIFTLYWVWDWPTMPDTNSVWQKDEIYTTCLDVIITGSFTGT